MSLSLHRPRAPFVAALCLALASLGGDCDGDLVDDPTFRDWCGDSLCSWTLDAGHITQAPTWSPDDLGVSFEEAPTQISQVTQQTPSCILFTTVADVDPSAQMYLLVDFNNDGTIDVTQPISGTWQNIKNEITAPAVYNGIAFHLRKEGTGMAILAEMRIQSSTGCVASAPTLSDLILGDWCTADGQCASGVCSTINVVGYDIGTCAQCSATVACANGATCEDGLYDFSQCGPGEHLGKPGDLCVTSDDCVSHDCAGVTVMPPPPPSDAGALDAGDAAAGASYVVGPDGGTIPCVPRETDGGADASACYPSPSLVIGGSCN